MVAPADGPDDDSTDDGEMDDDDSGELQTSCAKRLIRSRVDERFVSNAHSPSLTLPVCCRVALAGEGPSYVDG